MWFTEDMETTKPKTFDTINKYNVERIREACKVWRLESDGRRTFNCWAIEYGQPEIVVATGRARCRCCGQKIAKGETVLKFSYDFHGCGSWTAQTVHMHVSGCETSKTL